MDLLKNSQARHGVKKSVSWDASRSHSCHGLGGLCLWVLVIAVLCARSVGEARTAEVNTSLQAADIELQIARAAFPYLVLDLASNTIAIRMKGRTLEVVPLQGHRLLKASQLAATRQPLELPALWQVTKRPPARRKVTAPSTLTAADNPTLQPPASGETPSPPDVYEFETHQGWRVEIGRESIEPSRTKLWRQALADGLATRRGKIRSRPNRLVLEMSPESATRLHHLIRPEIPILILARGDAGRPKEGR